MSALIRFIRFSSWRGTTILLVVLGLGYVSNFLLVQRLARDAEEVGRIDLSQSIDQVVAELNSNTVASQPMGAVILLGLNEPLLKSVASGSLPANADQALQRMKTVRLQFDADGMYVVNSMGVIVAHETEGKSSVGVNVNFRPYFQRAMSGQANAYAAVGSNSDERGLYFSSPMYQDTTRRSPIIGAVAIKMPVKAIDVGLSKLGNRALLLSPQGVVFSATTPEWLFSMTASATPERVKSIRDLKQFGKRFANEAPPVLPFDVDAKTIKLNGVEHAAVSKALDWNDPSGEWRVLAMRPTQDWFPPQSRANITIAVMLVTLLIGVLTVVADTYRRKIVKDRRRLQILGTVLESSPLAVIVTEPDGSIEWVNAQYEKTTGHTLDDVKGKVPGAITASGSTPRETYLDMWDVLKNGRPWRGEFINRRKDGSKYWDQAIISPVLDDKRHLLAYVGIQEDVSLRKNMEAELRALAHFDKLTGLANRALFLDRLNQVAAQTQRSRNRFALLFIDLDGFKAVNDQKGHDTGDGLLKLVAERLQASVRDSDTVARMGGDEFTIILPNLDDILIVCPIAEKIITSLSAPAIVGEHVCHIGASIGIGIFPDDADDVSTLLSRADSAMYHVKRSGKNSYRFFNELGK